MADSIRLEVTRFRPDTDAEPHPQEYDVPLRKEWTILDGLNHVKNEVDTTLSFRWSCRMGICGSCGMNVDGEPRLTCAAFLSDYAPGPVRVEPLANFPVVRDLVVDLYDFMEKLPRVKPWIIRDDVMSVDDGEYLQTPEELDAYKQFSMCINCMLCYAACPVYGLDPDFIGPAAIALAERYDLDSRDRGAREARRAHRARGRLGVHVRRGVHAGVPEARRPRACDPAVQAEGGQGERDGLLAPSGRPMTDVRVYRRPVPTWWWVRKRSYFVFVMRELSSLFVAWLVAYLVVFLYAVGRSEGAYAEFLDWAATPWVVALNVVALLFLALHVVTWFSLTAQATDVKMGSRPVPAALVIASQYAGLVVVSAFVFWLVMR